MLIATLTLTAYEILIRAKVPKASKERFRRDIAKITRGIMKPASNEKAPIT